ncbi:MAG: TraB/GumN family protein [Sphingomonadaceae bacterium]
MRALLLLVALLLAAPSPLSAQPRSEALPPLWVIRNETTTIHIFGTVHALPRGTPWFQRHVVEALDAADRLVLETIVPADPMAMMGVTLRMARQARAVPLPQRVSPELLPTLAATLTRLNPGPLEQFKTWYVALTLANLATSAAGLDPATGVEAVLTERARLRKIPVEGLETVEQQLTYFDVLSEADQRLFLEATLEDIALADARTQELIDDWLAGRTDALAQRLNRDFEGSPMLKQLLLGDRNARFADWIATRLDSPGRVFVAIGAGHLAGPGNVLDLLARRGLRVERVMAEPPPARPPRRRS